MSDTSITFDTKFEAKEFDNGLKSIESKLSGMKSAMDSAGKVSNEVFGSTAQKNIDSLTGKLGRQVEAIQKAQNEAAKLKADYEKLSSGKITPPSVKGLESELRRAETEISNNDKLIRQYAELANKIKTANDLKAANPKRAGKADETIAKLQPKQELIGAKLNVSNEGIEAARAKAQALKAELEAIRLNPSTTAEAMNLANKLGIAEEKVDRLGNEAKSTEKSLRSAMNPKPPVALSNSVEKANKSVDKVSKSSNKASGAMDKAANSSTKLSRNVGNAGNSMNKTSAIIGKVTGVIMRFAAVGLGLKFAKDATKMAMDVESGMSNIERNLGAGAASFNDWVENQSKGYGIAKSSAYQYGSTYSNLISSFTKDTQTASTQTEKLMEATAVISSKTGRSFDDVADRIRSGLLGSTEAIEDLGIYTQVSMLESTDAFKKFAGDASWNQLSFQVQQQIRLAAIMEQSYSKYGNTLADTTQTRHNQFIASLNDIKLSFGKIFLNIYNIVLPVLTTIANAVGRVMEKIATMLQALTGKTSASLGSLSKDTKNAASEMADIGSPGLEQAEGMDKLTDSTKKASKEAKKAAKTLQGFDQLNILRDKDTSSSSDEEITKPSGSSGSGLGSVGGGGLVDSAKEASESMDAMKNKLDSVKDAIKGFYENWGAKDIFDGIKRGLDGVNFAKIKQDLLGSAEVLGRIGSAMQEPMQKAYKSMGKAIGSILEQSIKVTGKIVEIGTAGYNHFLVNNEEKIIAWGEDYYATISRGYENVASIADKVGDTMMNSLNEYQVELEKVVEDAFTNGFNTSALIGTVIADTFEIITQGIKDMLFDNEEALQLFSNNITEMFVSIGNFGNEVWADIIEGLSTAWEEKGKVILEDIMSMLGDVFGWMLTFFNETIKPIFDRFMEFLGKMWEFIKPIFASLSEFIAALFKMIKALWDLLKPVMDYLVDVVGKELRDAFEMIFDVAEPIFEAIGKAIVLIIDTLTEVLDFLANVFSGDWAGAWENILNIFENLWDNLGGLVKNPINIAISMLNGLISAAESAVNMISRIVNSIDIDAPDWAEKMGMNDFSPRMGTVKVDRIPKLAKGGLIPPRKPRQVIVGDNMVEDEIVSPVSTMKQAMADVLAGSGGNSNNNDILIALNSILGAIQGGQVIEMNERELGRAVVKIINDMQTQTGRRLI